MRKTINEDYFVSGMARKLQDCDIDEILQKDEEVKYSLSNLQCTKFLTASV